MGIQGRRAGAVPAGPLPWFSGAREKVQICDRFAQPQFPKKAFVSANEGCETKAAMSRTQPNLQDMVAQCAWAFHRQLGIALLVCALRTIVCVYRRNLLEFCTARAHAHAHAHAHHLLGRGENT